MFTGANGEAMSHSSLAVKWLKSRAGGFSRAQETPAKAGRFRLGTLLGGGGVGWVGKARTFCFGSQKYRGVFFFFFSK